MSVCDTCGNGLLVDPANKKVKLAVLINLESGGIGLVTCKRGTDCMLDRLRRFPDEPCPWYEPKTETESEGGTE